MSRLLAKPSTSTASKSMGQNRGRDRERDRDPPPALFLHPSRETSHVSLLGDGGDDEAGTTITPATTTTHAAAASSFAAAAESSSSSSPIAAAAATGGSGAPLTHALTSTPTRTRQLHFPNQLPPPTTIPRLPTSDSNHTARTGASTVRTADRTDALWAEMQATLEDVELSAGGGGTRVFGPDHDRALAELRNAQIALAQAWARSEADDAIETGFSPSRQKHDLGGGGGGAGSAAEVGNLKSALWDVGIAGATPAPAPAPATAATASAGAAGVPSTDSATAAAAAAAAGRSTSVASGDYYTDAGRSTTAGGAGGTATRPGSSSGAGTATGVGGGISNGLGVGGGERLLGAKLEQETQTDILHARKRREANDRYFSRVDQGVRDVVARLEEVAAAMRAVEQETRDVWEDEESSVAGSVKG